jgi:hypothetical protein
MSEGVEGSIVRSVPAHGVILNRSITASERESVNLLQNWFKKKMKMLCAEKCYFVQIEIALACVTKLERYSHYSEF